MHRQHTPSQTTRLNLSPQSLPLPLTVWQESLAIAQRCLVRVPRQLDWVLGIAVMPLVLLLLFRFVLADTVQLSMPPHVNAVDYIVVGIIMQSIFFSMVNTSIALSTDANEGVMDRFRSLPIRRISILLGRVMADVLLAGCSLIITVAAGLAVGFRPVAGWFEWCIVIAAMLGTVITVSWVGVFFGLLLRTPDAVAPILLSFIMPFTMISNAFIMPGYLPRGVEKFAAHQPFSIVVSLARNRLSGVPPTENLGLNAFIWMVVILTLFIPASLWLFGRRHAD